MQDTSVTTLNERIAQFLVEYYQGIDPEWLIKKYGFLGMLDVKNERQVYALNMDGAAILNKMLKPDPRDLMMVRRDQASHPDKYPWRTNPINALPHTEHPK